MVREVLVLMAMVGVACLVVWVVWATRRPDAEAVACKQRSIDNEDVDDEQLLY